MIAKSDENVKRKMQSLEEQHQERLESLTNKCLAFEEELSKCSQWKQGWVGWFALKLKCLTQHTRRMSTKRLKPF